MNQSALTPEKLGLPKYIQAFLEPEFYPHAVENIELIQTHISWIILTGQYAYKVKKPLNLGFLDFSTLKKRKYYCEQELILNQRITKNIYLEVCAVCLDNGQYQLGGDGEEAEYCLKMHQFNQAGLFDTLMAERQIKSEWMDDLAKDVARFHHLAEINVNPKINHASLLAEHIQGNLDVAADNLDAAISVKDFRLLKMFAETEIEKRWELLQIRQTQNHIRHCHGDLHTRNITLIEGKPAVFDCIEFNDQFRIIDTMNDVAFLVMDCDEHQRADLGFRFLSRYLEFSADYQGLVLLPLYLFYRASVRGKVACILAGGVPKTEQKQHWDEAKTYFELSLNYTKANKPKLFVVAGLSGSGKSFLALKGCGIERAIIIRSDAVRKRLHENLVHLNLYGQKMTELTYQTMLDAAKSTLKAGFSVILDATFLEFGRRQQVRELADVHGVSLHFYWLDIAQDVLKARIGARSKEKSDISDADLSVLNKQLDQYQKPSEPWVQYYHNSEVWPSK